MPKSVSRTVSGIGREQLALGVVRGDGVGVHHVLRGHDPGPRRDDRLRRDVPRHRAQLRQRERVGRRPGWRSRRGGARRSRGARSSCAVALGRVQGLGGAVGLDARRSGSDARSGDQRRRGDRRHECQCASVPADHRTASHRAPDLRGRAIEPDAHYRPRRPRHTAGDVRSGWAIGATTTIDPWLSSPTTSPRRTRSSIATATSSATARGSSGPTRATPAPGRRTSCTARTSPRARPASRSPSICRPSAATTPTTRSPRPEVGKVGVPINSLDDMHVLFDEIPHRADEHLDDDQRHRHVAARALRRARPRAWRGASRADRAPPRTTSIKEYLARGTYIFPPDASLRMIAEMYEYCLEEIPKWNPSNICSYHLQEAGATPAQELAFALANAIALLDLIKERGHFTDEQFERAVGRISFFVNAGIRFVEEMCKMRAFAELWDEFTAERFGVQEREVPPVPLRRAGQLARPHRVPAREQRLAHPDRDPRRHPQPRRPLPRAPAARVERGAVAAAPVGPAVVAAPPADPRLRDRPARVPRPVRGLGRRALQGRRAQGATAREEIDRILDMGGVIPAIETGLHEVRARALDVGADQRHQHRRADRRRAQPLDRGDRLAAARRRRRRHLRRRRVRST